MQNYALVNGQLLTLVDTVTETDLAPFVAPATDLQAQLDAANKTIADQQSTIDALQTAQKKAIDDLTAPLTPVEATAPTAPATTETTETTATEQAPAETEQLDEATT